MRDHHKHKEDEEENGQLLVDPMEATAINVAKYLGVTIDRTRMNTYFEKRKISKQSKPMLTNIHNAYGRVDGVGPIHWKKNIKSVENVQRQAARFAQSDYRRRSIT